MLNRRDIIDAVKSALEAEPLANAAWLGGSDAFGAADDRSDVDLCVDVADGAADRVFASLERALEARSPIAVRWCVPEPAWHGHRQRFYRLRDAPETALLDAVLMERSSTASRFDEREQHGEPVVLFDRLGVARSRPLDVRRNGELLRRRLEALVVREALFGSQAEKEAARGRTLDAVWAHLTQLILPLVEALRMRYAPARFQFGMRYLHQDLPADVAARLERLTCITGPEDVRAKAAEARAWLKAELETLGRA